MRSKCSGKELPPLSNFIQTKKFFCSARKGLGTCLALQRYAALRCVTQDLKAAVFPVKSRKIKEMRTRDKGKLFRHSFRSFIYSLPTQQDCVLPVVSRTVVTSKFKIRWFPNI